MTAVVNSPADVIESSTSPGRQRLLGRAGPWGGAAAGLRGVPHLPTYLGLGLVLAGGICLIVAWGKTAGLTNVGLQMPWVISAGCTGVALVAAGLTLVNLAAKAADARRRREQAAELLTVLIELRQALTDRETDR